MEHTTKKTNKKLYNFIEQDSKTIHLPSPPLSFKPQIHDNFLFSPSRSSTTSIHSYSLPLPPSPDSPWSLSPHQTPSPSLLYHCIASLHRQDGTIFSIAAAKGFIFTGTESSRIRAWRQQDCTERGYFKARYGDVRAILAHGNTLFTSHKDCQVRVWSISTVCENIQVKKVLNLPKKRSFMFFPIPKTSNHKHKDRISCMAYNHAEGILYTGSWDRMVKAWRVSDNRCVDSFIAHNDHINAILVNQNDGCLFTCSSDGLVKIWRRVFGQSSHTLTVTLKFQLSPVNALALSTINQNSCLLYSGSSDGFINFWEKEKMSGRYNHGGFLQGHRFAVLCLVAIEKLVFSGSEDTTIRIWRREENSCFHECLAVVDAHRGPVKCLTVSLEIEKFLVLGFLMYSSGLDKTFKVWRIKVSPEEMECGSNSQGVGAIDMKMKSVAYETSPVLSPSWVEKKLQGEYHHNHFY